MELHHKLEPAQQKKLEQFIVNSMIHDNMEYVILCTLLTTMSSIMLHCQNRMISIVDSIIVVMVIIIAY